MLETSGSPTAPAQLTNRSPPNHRLLSRGAKPARSPLSPAPAVPPESPHLASDIKVTMTIYAHAALDEKRKALKKLGDAPAEPTTPRRPPTRSVRGLPVFRRKGVSMRHLTRSFAGGALRRGREVEQLVEAFEQDGRRGLRWASISPATRWNGLIVRLHTVEDLDDTDRLTVDEYPSFHETDEEDFGQTIGETESAEEAIDLADRELGADPARWLNQGVLQDEYNDYVKQGRPLGRWRST